jgi:Rieske Fe-S protein
VKQREETTAPDGSPPDQQPAWRKDFPIDWSEDHYVARRDFTRFMVLTSLAFFVGQLWIGYQNWLRRRRGQVGIRLVTELAGIPVGGALKFEYPEPGDPCVLVRPDERTLLAYSQKCTHLSCAVIPRVAEGRFECPCHAGSFDLTTGRPLAGPPRRPLPIIQLEVRGQHVYATGVKLRTV